MGQWVSGSNGSTNVDGSRQSRVSTCDPLTHDPLTEDHKSINFKNNFNNFWYFGIRPIKHATFLL